MYRILIISLLLFSPVLLSAQNLPGRKISIKTDDIPFSKALDTISVLSGVPIFYSSDILPAGKLIRLNIENEGLETILPRILDEHSLTYAISGAGLVIRKSFNHKQKRTFSGYIREKDSKELLPGVNIYIPALKTGAASNSYGYYSLTLPIDTYDIVFSYVGFKTVVYRMDLEKDLFFNVELEPDGILKEVVITTTKEGFHSDNTSMSKLELPIAQVKSIPAIMGEKDVLKVFQLLPGIQKGSEGSSTLYVRGGGPDQNLIILDDALVYNTFHMFGFLSLFNGEALKSIELTKGGFPARFGGRLSSVVDMKMKEGNKERWGGEVGIGLLASRLTIEGPLKKGKSSFLFSARRTYADALIRVILPANELITFFHDVNVKWNYEFSPKNKVYLSAYFGADKFQTNETFGDVRISTGIDWNNATSTLRWNHLFSNKVFSNTSLIYSRYNLNISNQERIFSSNYDIRFHTGIKDFSLKHDLDIFLHRRHTIKAGLSSTLHTFIPSAVLVSESYSGKNVDSKIEIKGMENALYVEDEVMFSSRFSMNSGLRLAHFNNVTNYVKLEPRLNARYKLDERSAVKASYSVMNQYVHLLSNTGIGLPTDLWIPSTPKIKPQNAVQYAIGYVKQDRKKVFTLTLEAYYKKSKDILGYSRGANFLLIDDPTGAEQFNWENLMIAGQGWSYGTEFLLSKDKGKWTGWIAYTLSSTQLQFEELNLGKKFYAKYDRRHDLSFVNIFNFNERRSFSFTWVYRTGNAISLPDAEYSAFVHQAGNSSLGQLGTEPGAAGNFYFVNDYESINNYRVSPYHRLDISYQAKKKISWGERTWEFSIYNVYNRQNPYYYYIGYKEGPFRERTLRQVSLIPILPSISYYINF